MGLIVKLIVAPIGIILASWIFPNVNFEYWYQPVLLGFVVAIVGHLLEVAMLRKDTNWIMTILDFVISAAIVYFGALLFANSSVTFWGSLLTGALLAVAEYFEHNWLLDSHRARDEDTVYE